MTKLKLKENPEECRYTEDFYYDLFDGGYVNPSDYLDKESAAKVNDAIDIINEYQALLEKNNLLEEE